MEAAIILLAVFSVPLTAIVSSTYLKAKRLQTADGNKEIAERLKLLDRENADLRRRVEVLESIAIDTRELGRDDLRRRGLEGALSLQEVSEAQDGDETSARAVVATAAAGQR